MRHDDGVSRDFQWVMMSEMERAVWATTFAMKATMNEGALRAADSAVDKLRALEATRSPRLDPEIEAALSGINIERPQFDGWYRVALKIRWGLRPGFTSPTEEECAAAFERYRRAEFY